MDRIVADTVRAHFNTPGVYSNIEALIVKEVVQKVLYSNVAHAAGRVVQTKIEKRMNEVLEKVLDSMLSDIWKGGGAK